MPIYKTHGSKEKHGFSTVFFFVLQIVEIVSVMHSVVPSFSY